MKRVIAVDTPEDRRTRQLEFAAMDNADKLADEAKDRKNQGFTQVYTKGWMRLQHLMKTKPSAARVYAFLAQHIEGTIGSVVVSQQFMADELEIHKRTVIRLTAELEKAKVIVRIRVGTGVYAYCLDPEEVWKSYDDAKPNAAFTTKTLVKKADSQNKNIKRKLMTMMES